jgi:hypothetical protein
LIPTNSNNNLNNTEIELKDAKITADSSSHSSELNAIIVKKVIKEEKQKQQQKKPAAKSNTVQSSEARVTKNLAIIMGCFIACWLPFFTIYIIRSQLGDNANVIPSKVLVSFVWLGYFNSALNPILYAILNVNFRVAFEDILRCRCFK